MLLMESLSEKGQHGPPGSQQSVCGGKRVWLVMTGLRSFASFFLSCKSMFKLRPPDICSLVQFGHMHAFISNNKYAKNWTQESNDQILKLGLCELEEVEKLFNFSRLQYHLSKKRGLLIPEVLPKKKKSDSLLYRGKTPQQLLLFSHCLKWFICFLLITSKLMFVIF